MGTDIRIDSESNISSLVGCHCQLFDNLQFGNRFDIETGNALLQSEINLPIALAHACIHHLVSRKTCLDSRLNFAATHAVGTKTILADDTQYLRIGICFHGIVNVEVFMLFTFLFYNF
ncbi:unknown [Leyella stercorea CAG:629]|uniref:Uncharacterized protein n=1 Tax=Leyella stercorea CAG:629 TaxID=1263103 RepID=R7H692_9BACT|nr:unknown [Leyella stercorea CAG:629]